MSSKSLISLCISFTTFCCFSQQFTNSVLPNDTLQPLRFSYKQLIVPAVLIGYGFWGMESGQIKSFNFQIREEITENIDRKVSVDDFSRYVPVVSVYALNAFGIKGRHGMRDRSVILGSSLLIMSVTVFGLKSATHTERPDGSSDDSFPSGHTAVAFAGAEFLYQEYKDQSVWYGVAGYAVAAGTGLFRMYNNRHWLTDVAAGAGIGILSTKAAYWMSPYITRRLFGKKESSTTSFLAPSYDGRNFTVRYSCIF